MNYKILTSLSILSFLLCIFLFSYLYNEEKQRTIDELNKRQYIHAEQAAKGLESFIDSWIKQLSILASDEDIIQINIRGKKLIDSFFKEQKGQIKSLVRVNEKGIIAYAPSYLNLTGKDISKEKHIIEIFTNHKVIVSDIFRAVQGYDAIAIHAPLFNGTKFIGTIGAIIEVEATAKKFLADIKVGQNGYAWMISRDGTELYSPKNGHQGKKLFSDSLGSHSYFELGKKMKAGDSGYAEYYSYMINSSNQKKYAAFIPVHIGDTHWSIAVVSTEDDALNSLYSFKNKLLLLVSVLFITFAIFLYLGFKSWGIMKEAAERKRTELILQKANSELEQKVAERTEKLKKANADLESFNYTVSHDLKGPIRGINGFAQILIEDYGAVMNKEANSFLVRIQKAAEKVNILIESLLKLSKLNYHSLKISEVDLTALTTAIVNDLKFVYRSKDYEVKIQNNMVLKADSGLMLSLMQNLLDNAFKYSSTQDKPVIEVYKTKPEEGGEFCIKDNGAGFIQNESAKLFVPFKRFHNEDEFSGIGIGLAIVKKIIDLHNGKIRVESEPGKGTTFYFSI